MRAIIAILVAEPEHSATRRELIGLLWSDRGPEQARASLRQCLFTLRAEVPALVEADADRVWLVGGNVDLAGVDVRRATLKLLHGVDPAFDRWLMTRASLAAPGAPPADRTLASAGTRRRWPVAALTGAVLLGAMAAAWSHYRSLPRGPDLPVIVIAPFAAEPGTAATRAIADRLSDDLRALLPADRSVVRISDIAGDRLRQGRRLGADWVISGTVEASGGADKVHVEIETTDGRQIWGRDIDAGPGRLVDAAAIAATRVAMATGCALGGPRVQRDSDVLALLFEACERLDFSAANYSHQEAMVALRRLADRAPDDALAHAYFGTGLAVTADDVPPAIAKAQRVEARSHLDRAQRLDPRVGETWLGRFALVEDDRAYALREALLARGLAVEPTNPMLNGFMGELLFDVGRGDEGLAFERKAIALAPAYLATTQGAAGMLSAVGHPREALALLDIADRHFPRNARQAMQRLDALVTDHATVAARALLDRAREIPGFLEPTREASIRRLTNAMDAPHGPLAEAVAREAVADAETNPGLAPRSFNTLTELGRDRAALAFALKHALPGEAFFRLPARAVLTDPQFPVLARRAGLWDYWQRTGHWPDICRDPHLPWRCGTAVKSTSTPG